MLKTYIKWINFWKKGNAKNSVNETTFKSDQQTFKDFFSVSSSSQKGS